MIIKTKFNKGAKKCTKNITGRIEWSERLWRQKWGGEIFIFSKFKMIT